MKLRGLTLSGKWLDLEVKVLNEILKPLPREWVENNRSLTTIGRDSVLRNAPPEAPGHSKYEPKLGLIVVYDKGVYHHGKLDNEQFRRSVYHELAHSIIRSKPTILQDWISDTSGDGFVDEYAKTSPEEDFADTFSEFFIHRKAVRKAVPRKNEFIGRILSDAEEKIAMNFMNAFTDELHKTASTSGGLKKILEMASSFGKSGLGKGVMGATAGAGIATPLAFKEGDDSGFKSGTKGVRRVAAQQRMIGRREGAMAMYNYSRKRAMGQSQGRK